MLGYNPDLRQQSVCLMTGMTGYISGFDATVCMFNYWLYFRVDATVCILSD